MRTFIKNTNQYLLEHYPTIWNTKLIWMLGSGIIIHIVFYILGFLSLADVTLLHERNTIDNFFENGMLFFSIIITMILVVIWLTQLFKNNSFKNFYPTSRLKLFGQFFQYFIIILVCSTFYFSYIFGLKHYTNLTYSDTEFTTEVKRANQAALFLSHDLKDYTINNKKYPSPFDTIYCDNRNLNFIEEDKTFLEFYDKYFQFYTLYKLELQKDDITSFNRDNYKGYVFFRDKDSSRVYYYKDKVLNINSLGYNVQPSYFNYSDAFTNYNSQHNYNSNYKFDNYYHDNFNENKERILRNAYSYELLTRNNSKEIKELLNDFLNYCNKYKVKHNLTLDDWYAIVNTSNFYVTKLIKTVKPITNNTDYYHEDNRTAFEKYSDSITTDFYIESDKLQQVFKNIKTIKEHTVLNEAAHIFIWLSFLLALFIYIFRVSNLRVFIFSIITSGLLIVFVALITALVEFTMARQVVKSEYVIFYVLLLLGALILVIPLFYYNKLRKILVGICMNISIFGFVLYVLLIISIISAHQSDHCRDLVFNKNKNCFVLIKYLKFYTSPILLIIGFVFMYFYTNVIKRWMALPKR